MFRKLLIYSVACLACVVSLACQSRTSNTGYSGSMDGEAPAGAAMLSNGPTVARSASELAGTGGAEGAGARWNVYFGNLHAHSTASDGAASPKEAFRYARDDGKVSFQVLSEHNHMTSDAKLADAKASASDASNATFVAVVGQEFSTVKGGNHVNVYDVGKVIPQGMNKNYRKLYSEWVPQFIGQEPDAIVVLQFNHPQNVNTDYGISRAGSIPNYQGDFAELRADADPLVRLIAVISGPADASGAAKTNPPKDVARKADPGYLRCWKSYLDRGFHLSPVADQDNHSASWGNRTTSLTGVWIQGPFNKRSFLEALKQGRTFATEDRDMAVWMSIGDRPMGSRIRDPGPADLDIKVGVHDADEPDSRYMVQLFREVPGDGQVETDPICISSTIANGETYTFHMTHDGGQDELYYAQVRKQGGGETAYTAPIWIERDVAEEAEGPGGPSAILATAKFVGSKNSSVYHFPQCRMVKSILPENLVKYDEAPQGKRRHYNCPTEEPTE